MEPKAICLISKQLNSVRQEFNVKSHYEINHNELVKGLIFLCVHQSCASSSNWDSIIIKTPGVKHAAEGSNTTSVVSCSFTVLISLMVFVANLQLRYHSSTSLQLQLWNKRTAKTTCSMKSALFPEMKSSCLYHVLRWCGREFVTGVLSSLNGV